jgi:hypothetical protein
MGEFLSAELQILSDRRELAIGLWGNTLAKNIADSA